MSELVNSTIRQFDNFLRVSVPLWWTYLVV